jgi:hypothetical protein
MLHLFDFVSELTALAPNLLEAVSDLFEDFLRLVAVVPEQLPRESNVSQFNG